MNVRAAQEKSWVVSRGWGEESWMVLGHGKTPAQIGYSWLLPHSYVSWMRLGETSGRESLSQALQALPGRSCPAPCRIADVVDSCVRLLWEGKNQG